MIRWIGRGTHFDEEDGSEDGTPVSQNSKEVVECRGEVLRSDDGDRHVYGRCDDGEDEAGELGEEGEDDLQ